jgi:hypothetical protein
MDPSSRTFKLTAQDPKGLKNFEIKKIYWKLKMNGNFKRKVVTVTSLWDPSFINKALVAYYWADDNDVNHSFDAPVHGNATRTDKPFLSTEIDTMKEVSYSN